MIAVGGVIWGSVGLSGLMRDASPAAPSSSSENGELTWFTVPTNSWLPGDVGMQAHLVGVLRFTDDRCPFAERSGGRLWLAFPADARGAQDSAGKRYITNPEDRLYGVEGKVLDAGGGSIHRDVVTNKCGDTTSSIYGFGIMDAPSEQEIQPR